MKAYELTDAETALTQAQLDVIDAFIDRIAARIGRKRIFLLGLGLFTCASALCGLAPTAAALIATRALQALAAALLLPSSLALVLHAFPVTRRASAVALRLGAGQRRPGGVEAEVIEDPVCRPAVGDEREAATAFGSTTLHHLDSRGRHHVP